MQTQINIAVKDNKTITVQCPYHPSNISKFRAAAGKWKNNRWVLPDCENSRKLLHELFNWVEGCGTTQITLDFLKNDNVKCEDSVYTYKGYVLASRRSRDASVTQPHGVILSKGSYPESGGSVKNPGPAVETDENGNIEYILTMFDGKKNETTDAERAMKQIQAHIKNLKKEIIAAGLDDEQKFSAALDYLAIELLHPSEK